MKKIEDVIKNVTEENQSKVNWTKVWSGKYPILTAYQQEVDIKKYSNQIRNLLEDLKKEYNYSELDAVLVLKDILAHEMRNQNSNFHK